MRIKTSFRDAEEIMEVESYGEIQSQTRCRQRASPYLIRSKPFMLNAGVVTPIRTRWIDLVLSTSSLLLIVPGRSSPPRRTRRCQARVAMEVSVPASAARSLEPPSSGHQAVYRCSRVETWRLLPPSRRNPDFLLW